MKNLFTYNKYTLPLILFFAFSVRLIAVFFSKGYAAHDDHFIPVETAYQWLYQQVELFSDKEGAWRNQLYTLLHYSLFSILKTLGFNDPQFQMLVVRFLHSCYSMLSIIFGYKLTRALTDDKQVAILVSALLSFFWLFPFLAVRNLVEVVCIPPLIAAFYYHQISQKIINLNI